MHPGCFLGLKSAPLTQALADGNERQKMSGIPTDIYVYGDGFQIDAS